MKVKRNSSIFIFISLLALLVTTNAFAQPTVIPDTFTAEAIALDVISTGTQVHGVSAGDTEPSILGGERDAVLTLVSGAGTLSSDIAYNQNMTYNSAFTAVGTLALTWDGNDNDPFTLDPTGLGGLDITTGGTSDGFEVQVGFADGGFNIVLTIYSSATEYSEFTIVETEPVTNAGGKNYIVNYTDLAAGAGASGAADLANVGAIVLMIDGTPTRKLDMSVDFFSIVGEHQSIGDTVFLDIDNSGGYNAGDPGLPGVTVNLYDGSSTLVGTTVTDAAGVYSFSMLDAGDYTVTLDETTLPENLTPVYDYDGTGTAHTADLSLAAGGVNLDIDFGYTLGSFCDAGHTIGDTIWNDVDGNGTQEAGEAGISGVTVNLLDGDGNVIDTTVTGEDGYYAFAGLANGTYTVAVDGSSLPADFVQTFDYDGTESANKAEVTIADDSNFDLDFGYKEDDFTCNLIGTSPYITVELLDIVTNGDGSKTYSFTVTNISSHAVSHVAFELPAGVTAVSPADSSTYNGEITNWNVENSTNNPFYSIKFEALGEGPKYGSTETFEYTLPAGVSQPDMDVSVKKSRHVYSFHFDLASCDETGMGVCDAPMVIDFETDSLGNPLGAGDIITDQYSSWGVNFSTNKPYYYPLMIFDSGNPTGGDYDLGAPNQGFGGTGIGSGGAPGQVGQNNLPQGNILIISEDYDTSDPDDKWNGGVMYVTFDSPLGVDVLTFLDIDEASMGTIYAYDASGNLITEADMLTLGNNSYQTVSLLASDVSSLEITFPGSGSLAGLNLCGTP